MWEEDGSVETSRHLGLNAAAKRATDQSRVTVMTTGCVLLLACVLLLQLLLPSVSASDFPSKWKKCPKNDNGDCLKVAVQQAITDLKNGNRRLRMIPLDPLHFEKLSLNQGGPSPVSINLTFYDMDLIGSSSIDVDQARFDPDHHQLELNMTIRDRNAHLIGNYSIAGSILVLPIRGRGSCNITFVDLNIVLKMEGSKIKKNGSDHFKIEKTDFIMDPKRVYFRFDNLFDGIPQLGDNMNKFMNENWKEIIGELKGTVSEAMGMAMQQIADTFFSAVSIQQIYEN